MAGGTILKTERLILRSWRPEDLDPFAAMGADPEVMRYFPALLDHKETKALIARMDREFERNGFGWCAVEVPGVFDFIGFIGLSRPRFHTHFTPCVEVGWRLRRDAWGHGYATEGASACLKYAFGKLGLEEVVSMAVEANHRSRAVMKRLGMTRRPEDDYGHPTIPFDHPLRRHVLYRLSRQDWTDARRAGEPAAC